MSKIESPRVVDVRKTGQFYAHATVRYGPDGRVDRLAGIFIFGEITSEVFELLNYFLIQT